jgi:hypothetical protein
MLGMPGLTVGSAVLGPGALVTIGLADVGAELGFPGGTVGPVEVAVGVVGMSVSLPAGASVRETDAGAVTVSF